MSFVGPPPIGRLPPLYSDFVSPTDFKGQNLSSRGRDVSLSPNTIVDLLVTASTLLRGIRRGFGSENSYDQTENPRYLTTFRMDAEVPQWYTGLDASSLLFPRVIDFADAVHGECSLPIPTVLFSSDRLSLEEVARLRFMNKRIQDADFFTPRAKRLIAVYLSLGSWGHVPTVGELEVRLTKAKEALVELLDSPTESEFK